MRYISSVERLAWEKGFEQGYREEAVGIIKTALQILFPDECGEVLSKVDKITSIQQIRAIIDVLFDDDFEKIRRLLPD